MLHRKIESSITDWITNSKKALLIDGARQVGKTYIIRSVLEQQQCHTIEFNLVTTPELIPILASSISVQDMVTNLSLFTDQKFIPHKTILFFDEIQEYKDVATKIKSWVDEGSFRYIFSGSLLGVNLRSLRSAPVGYLRTLTMYPLDFEEFLQVYQFTDTLKNSLKDSFLNKTPVNETVHKRLLQIFHMYMNVGGMPAAVSRFQETHNLEDVITEHEDIILQYKRDFTRYETEDKKPYLTRIYDLIPAELNTPGKRFNFADLKKGLRFDHSESNFIWLEQAGVALPVYNIEEPTIPLLLNEKRNLFKLFLSDIGMLTTMYGRETKRALLADVPTLNYGALYENVVAQELKAHGFSLHYYNSKKYGELDFVLEYQGSVLPLEIKSGKGYQRHSALRNVLDVSNFALKRAFVLSNHNVEEKGNITYYPIYMLMFLNHTQELFSPVEIDDLSDL